MNDLKIFKNELFEVAVRQENGDILFEVEQVAKSLGFVQRKGGKEYIRWGTVNKYLSKYVSQDVGKGDLVPESLVYKLAFKASNELAEQFQDWLAIEVVPSIRKNNYNQQLPQSFSEALRLAADLQEEAERNRPKVEAHDRFISGENLQKVGDVAKALGYGRNKLFRLLRESKIFMKGNVPYQQYIDRGYFEVKETPITMGEQTINKPQTYVTAKGVDYIDGLLNKVK